MADSVATSNDSKKRKIVGCVDVGDLPPPTKPQTDVETIRFRIHNFAKCEEEKGECIKTPSYLAHGLKWYLRIYPRGDADASRDCVSIFFGLKSDTISAQFAKIRLRLGSITKGWNINNYGEGGSSLWGCDDFCKRREFLGFLNHNGSAIIEVDIQMVADDEGIWYPKQLLPEPTLVQLFQGTLNLADVKFSVAGKSFAGHSVVLATRCSGLYEMVEESKNATIKISGLSSSTFQTLLDFIYTVRQPRLETLEEAKEILGAANRFGVTNLKMLAESTIVDKFLEAGNAGHLLLYADSMTCPLLKEATMELHTTKPEEVEASDEWHLVEESAALLKELLKYPRFKQHALHHQLDGDAESIKYLKVNMLRERLQEAELDLDGTRDMLVARLKKHIGCEMDED